ncbi:MAG: type II secretion system GspH family protein [Clostridiales bacterium]|nr:type II secretion system GspH family protein [Clostridiales bacterium]
MKKQNKNKKGFSLIELIIVIAIMVSLIAILAPKYIKYVAEARDMTILNAAETVLSFTKTEFGNGTLYGNGSILVSSHKSDGNIIGIEFIPDPDLPFVMTDFNGNELTGQAAEDEFCRQCNLKDVTSKSNLIYEIKITGTVYTSFEITLEEYNERHEQQGG